MLRVQPCPRLHRGHLCPWRAKDQEEPPQRQAHYRRLVEALHAHLSRQEAAGSRSDTALTTIKRYVGGGDCYRRFPRMSLLGNQANRVGRPASAPWATLSVTSLPGEPASGPAAVGQVWGSRPVAAPHRAG